MNNTKLQVIIDILIDNMFLLVCLLFSYKYIFLIFSYLLILNCLFLGHVTRGQSARQDPGGGPSLPWDSSTNSCCDDLKAQGIEFQGPRLLQPLDRSTFGRHRQKVWVPPAG